MSQREPGAPVEGDVRARLVRAAEQLLGSSPDGQISTRGICTLAHVKAPTLYHHFTDKSALLDAVVLEGFTGYLEEKRAIAWSGVALDDFRTGWDVHVSFGCEHPAHYRLMFGNPQAGRPSPAALVARDEVARTVAEWGRQGQLKVSVDAATETMSAAAVGVTLRLIVEQADCTHPVSTSVRDTVAQALFHSPDADHTIVDDIPRSARQLLLALRRGPWEPLREAEVALLREWLHSLADTSTQRDRKTP